MMPAPPTRGLYTGGSRTRPTPRRSPSSPDGTTTANVSEMDGLLQEAWRPINCKYAVDPKPNPVAFLRRYGQHVRRVPMIASLIDGRRLHRGLSCMKPLALGLGGWSLADLRFLPDRLLSWLADLRREVERLGKGGTLARRARAGHLFGPVPHQRPFRGCTKGAHLAQSSYLGVWLFGGLAVLGTHTLRWSIMVTPGVGFDF